MPAIHASCIAIEGVGVLLLGPSGAGKSDLALRLIDTGAVLVADDYVNLRAAHDKLLASPPPAIAGALEIRGVGILRMDHLQCCPVGVAVDLVDTGAVPRLPAPGWRIWEGVAVPAWRLAPFESSAPAKIRMMVAGLTGGAEPIT